MPIKEEAKAAGDINKSRRLNAKFQRATRKDKETSWKKSCMKLEENCGKGHIRDLFAQVRKLRTLFKACKGMIKDKN